MLFVQYCCADGRGQTISTVLILHEVYFFSQFWWQYTHNISQLAYTHIGELSATTTGVGSAYTQGLIVLVWSERQFHS